jgi:hypothetical protein
MTLPDERYRSVVAATQLLLDLCQPGNRVPKEYKDRARHILRHYPNAWDMDRACRDSPDVFQKQMEPVTRLLKQYEQSKSKAD